MSAPREYVEIEVKSVLNRVTGMPFRWSINPYRGCSHGCVFCMSGETLVLMADGGSRRLDELRAGDEIYGTRRTRGLRRYVRTFVLAHWSVVKPAYRIELEDGTELIAGGDHRFLTDRGWKFVSCSDSSAPRRPHLTANMRLIGTGGFAAPPVKNAEYMRGYLRGSIRRDPPLWSGGREEAGRVHDRHDPLPPAPGDGDALLRALIYLHHVGFSPPSPVFREMAGSTRRADGVLLSPRRCAEYVQRIDRWPDDPSPEWSKGFLAGVFDAGGSYSRGTLCLSNADPQIVELLRRCLARLRFSYRSTVATRTGPAPIKALTLLGGLGEALRFFHSVDPAAGRKRNIDGQAIERAATLRVVAVEPAGDRRLFDITTGTGDYIANGMVSHNCYARRTHWFLDEDGVDRWSTKIFAKVNAPGVLRRELARPSWARETVALGTATDPYQAIEGRYRITRGILEALSDAKTPVGIVTRSPLIQRDIDLLRRLTGAARATVCVSVATTDQALARQIEPGVAPPLQRLRTIRRLSDAGIRCGVLLAPILPGLTDAPESLRAVVRAAREHGAKFLNHTALHLGPVTRESFFRFLARQHRDLLPRYARMYAGKYAPSGYRTELSRTVEAEKTQAGIVAARYVPDVREHTQLQLPLGDGLRADGAPPEGTRVPRRAHRELRFGREHYALTSPPEARSHSLTVESPGDR